MSDNKHWILKIVPALGFAAGIIMMAFGGTMVLASGAKLALFDNDPYSYITREQCDINYPLPVDLSAGKLIKEKDVTTIQRSEDDIQRCLVEKRLEEKNRYQNGKKQNIVDGLSSLLVGGILVLAFRKKK
jgi:hypothetical protein